ncbi:hydrogenase expression/formation protein HypE [Azospirillum thermophilum]|uniref:Hydrogenase expression/formation protein HypE n=1 Tax=Azospirillum thermophilum TaxID=2202148 RepID=A0A2S2CZ07_9PROT|nr:hydrogenase expression/formation protein HypE [Azospirillum thermophilum]AWK89721.1 hydrogenase expression/formation protein HypE [Azospirillum thermophilum]
MSSNDNHSSPRAAAPRRRVQVPTVTIAHGGGGSAMRDLVEDVFVGAFGDGGAPLEDQARLPMADLLARGDRLAFTTDSFVVHPLEFPGGDIGKLAVCGTVNDLSVGGAVPVALSCAVVIEEGLEVETLRRIARSIAATAEAAGVRVVTGDTKVVARGACDRLFINTSGVGVIRQGLELGIANARPGDAVIINGPLGDHGAAILAARGELAIDAPVASDCAPLNGLIAALLAAVPGTRLLRDATRGGLAAVLNEMAEASRVGVRLDEDAIPVRAEVRGFCELLGLDPLYLGNEGVAVAVVPADRADAALAALHAHPLGAMAARIGTVTDERPGRVVMDTPFGGTRMVDLLVGDPLPRIC